METAVVLIQLFIVLAFIFIGARVGGVGLCIYGIPIAWNSASCIVSKHSNN